MAWLYDQFIGCIIDCIWGGRLYIFNERYLGHPAGSIFGEYLFRFSSPLYKKIWFYSIRYIHHLGRNNTYACVSARLRRRDDERFNKRNFVYRLLRIIADGYSLLRTSICHFIRRCFRSNPFTLCYTGFSLDHILALDRRDTHTALSARRSGYSWRGMFYLPKSK